jgi:hypothetical protein
VGKVHLDDFGQVLEDARQGTQNAKEKKKFEKMLEDHKKLSYPD